MKNEQDKAQPIAGEFVVINDYYLDNGHPELKDNAFLASIPSMAGLCECAATKSDALHELMLSLEVKLAYDLGIELSSKRHHPATDWDALYAKFYNYYHNEPQSGGVSDIFQWFKNELTK